MEDACGNVNPDSLLALESLGHNSTFSRLARHPDPFAWHISSTTSSLEDASSTVTSCSIPSVCASTALSYPSRPGFQTLLGTTAAVAATSRDGLQQLKLAQAQLLLAYSGISRSCLIGPMKASSHRTTTSAETNSTCGSPAADPIGIFQQPFTAASSGAWSLTLSGPGGPIPWPHHGCSSSAPDVLRLNTRPTIAVTSAQSHNFPQHCYPPECGFEADLRQLPANLQGNIDGGSSGSEPLLMFCWPSEGADCGGDKNDGGRISGISNCLLQLNHVGSVGFPVPLLRQASNQCALQQEQHSLHGVQAGRASGHAAYPSAIPCGDADLSTTGEATFGATDLAALDEQLCAHGILAETLVGTNPSDNSVSNGAVALPEAVPHYVRTGRILPETMAAVTHGRSRSLLVDPSVSVVTGGLPSDLNHHYSKLVTAPASFVGVAPFLTCSSLEDSCASPGRSSPSTARTSSGGPDTHTRTALARVVVCEERGSGRSPGPLEAVPSRATPTRQLHDGMGNGEPIDAAHDVGAQSRTGPRPQVKYKPLLEVRPTPMTALTGSVTTMAASFPMRSPQSPAVIPQSPYDGMPTPAGLTSGAISGSCQGSSGTSGTALGVHWEQGGTHATSGCGGNTQLHPGSTSQLDHASVLLPDGSGVGSNANSRLRRSVTAFPVCDGGPNLQCALPRAAQGNAGCSGVGSGVRGCVTTAAVMRSSSSPLFTLTAAGGCHSKWHGHTHAHTVQRRQLAAKAAGKAAAVAAAAAAAAASVAAVSNVFHTVANDGSGVHRATRAPSLLAMHSGQLDTGIQSTGPPVKRPSPLTWTAAASLPMPFTRQASSGPGDSLSRVGSGGGGSASSPGSSSPRSSSPSMHMIQQQVSEHQALRLISCTLRVSDVKRGPGTRTGRVLTPEELSRRMLAERGGGGATKLLLTRAACGTADLPPPASRSPRGIFPPIAEDEAGPQEGGPTQAGGAKAAGDDASAQGQPSCGCIVM